jgi:formamidopyrimidine-DNA glycosylase
LSIELPESKILAEQMDKELRGKRVKSCLLQNYERLQKIGMLNKNLTSFDQLVDGKIEAVISRGNLICVKFDNGMNLIIGPEYGGKVFYHTDEKTIPNKLHLKVDFSDGTVLTVRLTSMGIIKALKDEELDSSYVFKRDFSSEKLSPLDKEFTVDCFSTLLAENNRMLKTVLVGKDALVVGLSNSAFQDIIYRAKLHPKRKASEMRAEEKRALYDAIRFVINERIQLNGKDQFYDFYGNKGSYTPAMNPNMKQKSCPNCGTPIEKLSHGGGHVYLCPKCQV